MEVPGGTNAGTPTAAPPFITFGWGTLKFKGACTSLTCTYKLFTPEGEPLRADVKLSLTQTGEPPKGQNPTTRAQAGFGVHRVKDGDTLPSISYSRLRRRDGLAPDRGGERHRQPAAPAPRLLAVAAEHRELMPARRDTSQGTRRGDDRHGRRRATRPQVRATCCRGQGRRQPDAAGHGARADHATSRARTSTPTRCKLGAKIEIKAGDMGANDDHDDLQGPDRGRGARVHAAGRRDLDPRLRQGAQAQPPAKTRTFQQMSASDMVQQGRGRGRPAPWARSSPRASSTSSSSRATRPTGISRGGSR